MAICALKLEVSSGNAEISGHIGHLWLVWPCIGIGDLDKQGEHLVYITSRFVHNFVAICEFKMESGNALTAIRNKNDLCDLDRTDGRTGLFIKLFGRS